MGIDERLLTLRGSSPNLGGVNTVSITGATYPLSDIEDLVFIDTTSNLVALTAPDPSVKARAVTIVKTNAGANGITVAAYGAETFNGAAGPYTLPNSNTAAKGCWTLTSDGTNWTLTSTANTATGSGGSVSGTPVAGGLVSGAGVVSNQFGGLALRSAYTPASGTYLFSITALPAGTKMLFQLTQTDTAGGPFQMVMGASQHAAPHDIDWFQVYQDTVPSSTGPDAAFYVLVFAVYP
jgi:hypothetical protein